MTNHLPALRPSQTGQDSPLAAIRHMEVRLLLGLAAAAAIAVVNAAAATASHNPGDPDEHSTNMSLVANASTGQGGDFAFWGDTAVVTHGYLDDTTDNDGFKLLDVSDPRNPREIRGFRCVNSNLDVSVWRTLVFLSQDTPSRGTDCEAGSAPEGGPGTFAGIRIVSIADPARPKLLTSVPTNCALLPTGLTPACSTGSHTHTLVPDLKHRDPATGRLSPRLILYASGAHTTIVEVPLRDPAAAESIGTVNTAPSAGCHDVGVFVPRKLAMCAGINASQLWDISNPAKPAVLSVIDNPEVEHEHSAVFSWDGKTLVLQEESLSSDFTGTCWAGTEVPNGALRFYDITDPREPQLIRSYQDPHHVNGTCYGHYADVVPLLDERDVLTIAWGRGGTRVIDFTDVNNPARPEHPVTELGYYIPEVARSCPTGTGAPPPCEPATYASYWYNGFIYANHAGLWTSSDRGLDIMTIDPPALDSAASRSHLNAQTQEGLRN